MSWLNRHPEDTSGGKQRTDVKSHIHLTCTDGPPPPMTIQSVQLKRNAPICKTISIELWLRAHSLNLNDKYISAYVAWWTQVFESISEAESNFPKENNKRYFLSSSFLHLYLHMRIYENMEQRLRAQLTRWTCSGNQTITQEKRNVFSNVTPPRLLTAQYS